MVKANMLQIIVFSLFVGAGITVVGEKANALKHTIDGLADGFLQNRWHDYGCCSDWCFRSDYSGSCI